MVSAAPGNPGAITPVPNNPFVCIGSSESYTVAAFADLSTVYHWTVPPGATITSGANTNGITVLFGPGSSNGNVTVYGSTACGNGPVSTLPRVVKDVPVAPGPITGNPAICLGTTGVVYSVTPVVGATSYFWTVPAGATITSIPPLTNTITVDFLTIRCHAYCRFFLELFI